MHDFFCTFNLRVYWDLPCILRIELKINKRRRNNTKQPKYRGTPIGNKSIFDITGRLYVLLVLVGILHIFCSQKRLR